MRRLAIIIIVSILILPTASLATFSGELRSLEMKLERWDIAEAWSEVKDYLLKEPHDPRILELASLIAFHKGDYQEARKFIRLAMEIGGEQESRKGLLFFIEETMRAVSPLKKYESPNFIIFLDEQQDGFLIDYLQEALEKACQAMARNYGFQPKEKIRVEVFPNARAFYQASSLLAKDLEKGAVGLAKFNKLMLLSPAALVHGYRWLDAISHEYIHYVIVKLTANKAPIWFHEGLAKYEETRWREGPSYLSPLYQSLLLKALREERLIRFDRMEPSIVRLDTPEEVQLAYAQAASAIEFIIAKAGQTGLQEIMKSMAGQMSKGARESIQAVLGLNFEEFERKWKEFLGSKEFKEATALNVRRFKVKEGKADEARLDLEEIQSIIARNRAHLADRLRERGRISAAVIEYHRALAEAPDSIPIINRLSSALAHIGKDEEALSWLKRAKEISPDYPAIYTNLGKIYLKQKDFKKAKEAFLEALQINPFNPEVHQGLGLAYEMLGEEGRARRQREILSHLKR